MKTHGQDQEEGEQQQQQISRFLGTVTGAVNFGRIFSTRIS